MTGDVVTFGFHGDVSRVATLGFGAPPVSGVTIAAAGISITMGLGATTAGQNTLHEFVKARLSLLGLPVYVGALPQTHKLQNGPAITYMVPERPFGHHLLGADGTSQAEVEISVWSLLESASDAWGQAIRDRFDGYVGDIATFCLLQDEGDQPHPPASGSDQWLYEIRYRYLINHRVPFPGALG